MHIEYTIIVIIVAHHTYDIDDIARQRRRVRRRLQTIDNFQYNLSHWIYFDRLPNRSFDVARRRRHLTDPIADTYRR